MMVLRGVAAGAVEAGCILPVMSPLGIARLSALFGNMRQRTRHRCTSLTLKITADPVLLCTDDDLVPDLEGGLP